VSDDFQRVKLHIHRPATTLAVFLTPGPDSCCSQRLVRNAKHDHAEEKFRGRSTLNSVGPEPKFSHPKYLQ